MNQTTSLPVFRRDAQFLPASLTDDGTIDVIFTAGATVRRRNMSFWNDDVAEFDEELVVTKAAIRIEALNNKGPFLDSHRQYGLDGVLGVVVRGSVKIENNQGLATIKLSRAQGDADIIGKIKDGIIANISCGYRIHRIEEVERKDKVLLRRIVDWEPLEISAVAIGADPEAKVRSGEPQRLFECRIERAGIAAYNARRRMLMRQKVIGLGR